MRATQQGTTWPYLAILACLFALSVMAPRTWERVTNKDPLADVLAARGEADGENDEIPSRLPPVNAWESSGSDSTVSDSLDTSATANLPGAPADDPAEGVASQAGPTEGSASEVSDPAADAPDELAVTTLPDHEWALPTALIEQLDRLAENPRHLKWTSQVKQQIQTLFDRNENSRAAASALRNLRELAGLSAPANQADPQFLRAQYAVIRRVDVWEHLPGFISDPKQHLVSHSGSSPRMSIRLSDVDTLTRGKPGGAAWREYLMLEQLQRALVDSRPGASAERRELARKVLERLNQARYNKDQRLFVSQGPVANLKLALENWASEPVEARELLKRVEQYETSGLASDARLMADQCRWLRGSSDPTDAQLADRLEERYRNANLRVAVTGALLNRLVRQPSTMETAVNDQIVGVNVRGRQTTFTKLFLRLTPDDEAAHLSLEARGRVSSDTSSSSGPATFYNTGDSSFFVRKGFVIDQIGLRAWPATAEATNNSSNLISLRTDYDGVPLFGQFVRNIARNQHDELQGEARFEVERKVANRAREQFDNEVQPRLIAATNDLERRIVAPLEHLGVTPVPRGMSTSKERVMLRFCLAGEDQLGSHTPRPRAPSTSALSLQLHHSALNNAIQRLELDGRQFTVAELFRWIGEKTNRPDLLPPDDVPDDVTLTFADKDALRLEFADGRVEVNISLAELTQGRKVWRDFSVRTCYRPEPEALQARFVRDSNISLDGKSFKGKPEIVLRSILSKVLMRNRPVNLITEQWATDPRLQDLEITQLVVQDGWIGLAYGTPTDVHPVALRDRRSQTR